LKVVKKSRRLGYTQSRQGLFTENNNNNNKLNQPTPKWQEDWNTEPHAEEALLRALEN